MNASEEIVREWLHICKCRFTIENIKFKVPGGTSDIDILAVDSNGNYYDYEVKGHLAHGYCDTEKETLKGLVGQILREEKVQKIKEIIGDKPCQHILVTTHVFFGRKSEKKAMTAKG